MWGVGEDWVICRGRGVWCQLAVRSPRGLRSESGVRNTAARESCCREGTVGPKDKIGRISSSLGGEEDEPEEVSIKKGGDYE